MITLISKNGELKCYFVPYWVKIIIFVTLVGLLFLILPWVVHATGTEISTMPVEKQVVSDFINAFEPIGLALKLAVNKLISILPNVLLTLMVLTAISLSIYFSNRKKESDPVGIYELQDFETFGRKMDEENRTLEEAEAKENCNVLRLSQRVVTKLTVLICFLFLATPILAQTQDSYDDRERRAVILFEDTGDMILWTFNKKSPVIKKCFIPLQWDKEDRKFLEGKVVTYSLAVKIFKGEAIYFALPRSDEPAVQALLEMLEPL
ncbi:MAG: hypothetical protein WCV59_03160 [Parcubacteria group bacterium]|jgi:hypothetical protein